MILDMNYWTKVIKKILILGFTILFVFLSFKLAIFYMPFLIAFILSLLLEPVIKFFMKKCRLKRKTSFVIVFIISLTIIIGLIVWGIATLISESSNLLGSLNIYINKIGDVFQRIISSGKFENLKLPDNVVKALETSSDTFLITLTNFAQDVLKNILNFITSIPTIVIYIVITFIALYFICTDKIFMIDQLEHHFPDTWVKKVTKNMKKIIKSLGCYIKAEMILVLISFFVCLTGLYIFKFANLNIEYPLLAALGIGFIDALPIFGSGTVMVPWAIIVALNGDLKLGIAITVLWIIMSVVRQLFEPKVVSNQIGIHPIFTLIAMYTGYKFIGILGMLIGPIVLIILKNVFGTVLDKGILKTIFDRP